MLIYELKIITVFKVAITKSRVISQSESLIQYLKYEEYGKKSLE